MKSSIPIKFWRSLNDTCQCTHLRSGHATEGKGRCLITDCICKKFSLLHSSSLSELTGDENEKETRN